MKVAIPTALVAALVLPSAAFGASPTVVELYQSQGCSSCPPAIANVNRLVERPDILALTFAVTYWDQLGWKDTFASPEFTARQYDYSHGLHHSGVYTPQVVIDGRSDLVGADRGELDSAVARATPVEGPAISATGTSVMVGPGKSQQADVWLVRYDPRTLNVAIGRGENSGVTIAHRDVVRQLVRLGVWSGTGQTYALPAGGDPGWRSAILLQSVKGGPILSAAKL
jgi:hypothetical protein